MSFKIELDVLEALDPYKEQPHGDRYIVEEADIGSEKIVDGQRLFVAQDVGYWEKNPLGQRERWVEGKSFEEINGYFIGRVIAKGNGHRLERDEVVPMPFEVGDVLRIERFTGRKWSFQGRKYRLVNQVDCLSLIPDLSPERKEAHPRSERSQPEPVKVAELTRQEALAQGIQLPSDATGCKVFLSPYSGSAVA